MPDEQPASEEILTAETATSGPPEGEDYEPFDIEGDELDEPEQLPRRPRQRLLTPIPVALIVALMTAAGFIGGVLVEKGEGSSSGSASSGSAGLSALRSALGRGGAARGGSSSAAGSSGAGTAGLPGGSGVGATVGTVAFAGGSILYVTNSQGNTVKVTAAAGASVTKTVTATVKSIRPGETITVTGATGANGAISAESIRVGGGAGAGGGLGALLGGSGADASGGASRGSSGASSEPALFGKGG
jgi:hypothetical protein